MGDLPGTPAKRNQKFGHATHQTGDSEPGGVMRAGLGRSQDTPGTHAQVQLMHTKVTQATSRAWDYNTSLALLEYVLPNSANTRP